MEQIILKYFKFFDNWKLFAENGYWKLFLLSFCSFRTMTSSTFHIDFWIEKQLTIVLNQKQLKNNSSSFLQFRKWRINLAQIFIQIERMQAFYNCKYDESFCYCEAKNGTVNLNKVKRKRLLVSGRSPECSHCVLISMN